MKTNNKTTKAIRPMRAALLAAAMGLALLLGGCSGGGGGASSASSAAWPPTTAPATSQTNTYIGTQSPGLYTVAIDHTQNTYSYQDLSAATAPVTGTFTTAPNGYLVLSTGGYALEMLSRVVVLDPNPGSTVGNTVGSTLGNLIFAIASPACQTIPSRTKFAYVATPTPYYGDQDNGSYNDQYPVSGEITASSSNSGQDWEFDGSNFDPDLFTGTCAGNAGSSVIQTAITESDSLPASFAVGPTGFFLEDNYQSSGAAFIGAFEPPSPVDLSQLNGTTFVGMTVIAGSGNVSQPQHTAPQLVSFNAAPDTSGTSVTLTGGAFPANDPTQTPGTGTAIDLGAQDPQNDGSFPNATVGDKAAQVVVSNAGGKYTLFVTTGSSGFITEFILFQQ